MRGGVKLITGNIVRMAVVALLGAALSAPLARAQQQPAAQPGQPDQGGGGGPLGGLGGLGQGALGGLQGAQYGAPGAPMVLSIGNDNNFDPNQPIRAGFTLSVQVQSAAGNEADLSGTYMVDPSGSVQMKLAGPIAIKGLTPVQAADRIAVALRPYIKEPKVTVSIMSTPKPIIIIGGAVVRGGPVIVSDNTPLAEVLSVILPTESADLSRVIVSHVDEKGNRTTKEYNFLRWMKPAPGQPPDESQNPVLSDRDFIFVPLKTVGGTGSVTVEGAVLRQGIVETRLGVPLRLREAISLSGGPMPTADHRRVVVRRQTQEVPIVADYDRMEADDPADNVVLQPGDVVYVETLGYNEFVNMNGSFVRPGKLPYTRAMTLTQAIGEASGLTPVAKEKEGRIYRHIGGTADPTKTQIIAFNYIDVRKGKQPDVLLEPGDTVEMPTGFGPRPPLSPLETTQALLSIALIVDRLAHPNSIGF